MQSKWHVAIAVLVLCGLFSLPAAGQQDQSPNTPKENDFDGVVQNLIANRKLLQTDRLLTVELANSLVSSNDLGIDVMEAPPSLRAQLNLTDGAGLVVSSVPDESPGASAGLKAHDVLVKVGGTTVGNTEQLVEALKTTGGKPVKIEVIRQGKSITVEATPKSPVVAEVVLSDTPVRFWTELSLANQERYRIGVVLSEADQTLRAQLGLAEGEGLIVTEVFPDTPAAKMGLQTHDVLTILDGQRLTTVDAVNAQIQEIKDREVELQLLRSGKEVSLKIAPAKETMAAFADLDRQPLTVWSTANCPGQVQHKCGSCHVNPHADASASKLHGHLALSRWFAPQPAQAGSPQEQVNQLKDQLARMQQTLSSLETILAAGKEGGAEPKADQEEKK